MKLFAKCLDRCYFVDQISGKSVGLYQTKDGRKWMSDNRWLIGAVEVRHDQG